MFRTALRLLGHSNPFHSKSALHNLIARGIADQLKPLIDRIVVLLAPSGGLAFSYTTVCAESHWDLALSSNDCTLLATIPA